MLFLKRDYLYQMLPKWNTHSALYQKKVMASENVLAMSVETELYLWCAKKVLLFGFNSSFHTYTTDVGTVAIPLALNMLKLHFIFFFTCMRALQRF